jgi:hypothetical protein
VCAPHRVAIRKFATSAEERVCTLCERVLRNSEPMDRLSQ